MADYVNQHGRKWGRGGRPWLLIPKVLGAAAYFGGVLAALVIACTTQPETADQVQTLGGALSVIFLYAAVPGLVVAIVCGAGLLWMHGRPLLRMRWIWAKVIVVALTVPPLHLWMSMMVRHLRLWDPAADSLPASSALAQIRIGLIITLVLAAAIIWLGRHKPRLGQSYGPARRHDETTTEAKT